MSSAGAGDPRSPFQRRTSCTKPLPIGFSQLQADAETVSWLQNETIMPSRHGDVMLYENTILQCTDGVMVADYLVVPSSLK